MTASAPATKATHTLTNLLLSLSLSLSLSLFAGLQRQGSEQRPRRREDGARERCSGAKTEQFQG